MSRSIHSRQLDWTGRLPVLLALLGCGLLAVSIPPVPDHAYQFHLAERLLDGARLYVDVAAADMHPPLFTWLAVALESAGRPFGVPGLEIYPVVVVIAVSGSLFAAWRVGPCSPFLFAVLIFALLPAAGPYFGQGDHLALALALPYLFATAAASRGETMRPATRIALAITAAAGLAMKPYFALVWICAELYLARRRGVRSLFRPESVAIASVFLSYVLATAIVTPEFFTLLPWLTRLYPRFVPLAPSDLFLDWRTLLLAAGLAAGRTLRRRPQLAPLADLLSLTALSMYAAVLLQMKGWGYHWYPVNALAIMLIGLAAEPHIHRFRLSTPALALLAVFAMSRQVDRTIQLLASPPTFLPELLRITDEHAQGQPIVALSHYLHPAFPLVNLTRAQWVLPYAHLWMVPAIYSEAWRGEQPVRYREAGSWRELEQQIFDNVWSAIERARPALLIVETPIYNRFDMRTYFETDPRYRALFQTATVIDTVGFYVIYRPANAKPPQRISRPD